MYSIPCSEKRDAASVDVEDSPPLAGSDDPSLQVLLLEDSATDAELITYELEQAGFSLSLRRVETRQDYLEALSPELDLILSDHALPQFDAPGALSLLKEHGLDVPFIIVSGVISEEAAVAAMKQGASDYLLKDRLARLGPAVRQAIKERDLRRDKQEAEVLSRTVLRSLATHIAVLDRSGYILAVNEAWETFAEADGREEDCRAGTGVNYLEMCRRAFRAGAEAAGEVAQGVTEVLEHRRACFSLEYPCPTEDEQRWFYMQVSPLEGTRGGAVVSHQEITERKLVEQELSRLNERLHAANDQLQEANRQLKEGQAQLVHTEKMASLGQLAAGIAHEINNPVGFVMSNLETMSQYVEVYGKLLDAYGRLADAARSEGKYPDLLAPIEAVDEEEDIGFIREDSDLLVSESLAGTHRVKEIVQGLKSFARVDEAEMQEADINECINTTLRVIWNELKYKCGVDTRLEPLPRIRCYPGQLNQVFMNLLVNAAHAIPERGDITIETRATDEEVVIRIADTGAGIAPEHLPKIFNPFFTTKPVGKGTGLGLSISYGIIQKHGGHIDLDSKVGEGTTFTIRLPIRGGAHE